MKKYFVCCTLLLTLLLSGCGARTAEPLTVSGRAGYPLEESLREQFPDIPFEFQYYDGYATTSELTLRVQNRDIPDIYVGTLSMMEEDAEANLLDLSGYSFCNNFEPSILQQFDRNGHIYQLPGSVTIRCAVYNKEMFDQHGWQEPQTFDELVALCRQIRAEAPGITPIVFGGAANGYYFTTMTTFSQAEFLHTPAGLRWERAYLAGNAPAVAGFGTGIQMVQELIDAGAFDYRQNLNLWDAAIFSERMATGQAAIQFVWGAQQKTFEQVRSFPDTYKVIPFRNRNGDAVIGTGINGNIGLSKRLGEPGNEKKLENALRVLEWFSTEEGQMAMNNKSVSVIYPIKNAANQQTIPVLRDLWYSNLNGIKAPMLYSGYEDIVTPAADYIVEAVQGKHDLRDLSSLIDEIHQDYLAENADSKQTYLGSFSQDFTHEETVWMVAEMIQDMGDSDITLVSDGHRRGEVINRNGVHSNFYEGPLINDAREVYGPGNLEIHSGIIVQMTLTGAQIQELLEQGKDVVELEDLTDEEIAAGREPQVVATSTYPYYYAGMTAQWKKDKVTGMALDDGTPMEPDQTYTVSFAWGDYMESTAAEGHPVQLDFTAVDALTGYLQAHSPVAPLEKRR